MLSKAAHTQYDCQPAPLRATCESHEALHRQLAKCLLQFTRIAMWAGFLPGLQVPEQCCSRSDLLGRLRVAQEGGPEADLLPGRCVVYRGRPRREMIPALVWSAGKLYPMAVNPTIMSSYLPFLPSALRATAHSHGMPTVAQCVMPCSAAADSREAAEAAPFVEKLRKRGYEVLYLTEPIDEVAVSSLQVGTAWGCKC